MDFEKDTDIIPGEKDEHQLRHKCNGDKPWSPVFRSEKPCDTGRCVWKQTELDPSIYLNPVDEN